MPKVRKAVFGRGAISIFSTSGLKMTVFEGFINLENGTFFACGQNLKMADISHGEEISNHNFLRMFGLKISRSISS